MKKIAVFAVFLFSFFPLFSQPKKYRIFFTDKNNSPYNISNPSAFLTARSIQRRANQNIAIQQNDLPPNPPYVQQVLNTGATYLHQSRWFNSVTVEVPNTTVLNAITALPCVQTYSAVNRIKKKLPEEYEEKKIPAQFTEKLWLQFNGNVYDYGKSYDEVNQLGGVCLHNMGFDGRGMVICVLDAGFYNANNLDCFDSLFATNRLLGTWDYVENETNVFDDHQHGTMVLSCMAANLPGQLIGTAPQASYWLIHTEEAATELIIEEDNWAAGAEFADSVGADVINSSLGYTTFDIASQNHTYADLDGNTAEATIAADLAASKGILVCNSAGNEGNSSWRHIGVPADADSVVTVGAVDANGTRAGFSSQGPTYDGRIKPDVAANGNGTYLIDAFSNVVTQSGGTSFSSPLTAGMAACLWQSSPAKTNMEIINAMRAAGNQASNSDTLLGWGIPNYCKAYSMMWGGLKVSDEEKDQFVTGSYNADYEKFEIYYYSYSGDEALVTVTDLAGKQLLSEKISPAEGILNYFSINGARDLSTGIYIVSIRTSGKPLSKKIMKY
jgi:serine protease AprX